MLTNRKTFLIKETWKSCLKFSALKCFPELRRIRCALKIFLLANPTSVEIHLCMNSCISSKAMLVLLLKF